MYTFLDILLEKLGKTTEVIVVDPKNERIF